MVGSRKSFPKMGTFVPIAVSSDSSTFFDGLSVDNATRLVKPVELFLNDQHFFAQGVGLVGEPFLQVVSLAQVKVGKTLLRKT